MNVLAIESSCDESAAAVVRDGQEVLSSVIHTQIALHAPYGGVVPEIASRSHVVALPRVIDKAIEDSGLGFDGIDAVAVTYGPGLSSSLLVGLSTAKALAMRLGKPLIGINHLEAHMYSVFIGKDAPAIEDICPFLTLIVSGGHTIVLRVNGLGDYTVLGQTLDDAAGEAFDKGANLLNLGFPGGPAIDKAAREGNPSFVDFPRGRQRSSKRDLGGLDADLCFSFSGLKTALLYYLKDNPVSSTPEHPTSNIQHSTSKSSTNDQCTPSEAETAKEGPMTNDATSEASPVADVACSYQEAIVDALIDRCDRALSNDKAIVVGGGVSLNSRLRTKLSELAERRGVRLVTAEPRYCADNAAMIAGLAGAGQGVTGPGAFDLDVQPNLQIS